MHKLIHAKKPNRKQHPSTPYNTHNDYFTQQIPISLTPYPSSSSSHFLFLHPKTMSDTASLTPNSTTAAVVTALHGNAAFFSFLSEIQMLELLSAVLVFITIHSLRQKKRQGLPNWPLVGMLPSLVLGLQGNMYEWISSVLCRQNGTFTFTGPWFSNLKCVVTSDPRNLEYLLKTRFSNFPKGEYFRDTVKDLLGDGIFSADDEIWQKQRKTASLEFHSGKFRQMTSNSIMELVHARLLPVLEDSVRESTWIDLQDILLRLTFDNVCIIAFGVDPGCLRPGLPDIPFASAFEAATEATIMRFVMPTVVWKLMRQFNLGTEGALKKSIQGVDGFAREVIQARKKELALENATQRSDLLSIFMGLRDEKGEGFSDEFLRDICVNFILAGRDTSSVALSWFFWLLSKNPEVEENILKEICCIVRAREGEEASNGNGDKLVLRPEEIKKMEYLQAALSEALRLYPSVRNIRNGEDGGHLGEGLPAVQPGPLAARWPVHERVSLQVHGVQRRASPLPGARLRVLPDEVRGGGDSVQVPSEGSRGPPGGPEDGADDVHEARAEGGAGEARSGGAGEVFRRWAALMAIRFLRVNARDLGGCWKLE